MSPSARSAHIRAAFPAKTTKIKVGKKKITVGLLSSVSCPKNKKRPINVTYTAADGSVSNSFTTTPCKS